MADSLLALSFACCSDPGGGFLLALTSSDGITWTRFPWNYTGFNNVRDPSLLLNPGDSKFYCCYSKGLLGSSSNNTFGLLVSDGPGETWTALSDVAPNISGLMIVAAPHWFVDGDGSVHVIVALSTSTSPFSQQIYEMHPTASDFSTWSTPTLLISTMGAYDPCVVLYSCTYYLFFSSIVCPAIISVCSASSLTGTYSAPSALGINGEGANVVKLGSTWYLYHDNNYPQLDFWNGSNEYATASSPGGTWTNQTRIAHDVTSNDGWFNTRGLKRVAVLNLDGSYVIPGIAPILSGESWPLHYINSIESTTGFSGAVGGRLGLSRLGLLRLGTWVANTSNPITPTPIAPAAPAIRSAEVWPRP